MFCRESVFGAGSRSEQRVRWFVSVGLGAALLLSAGPARAQDPWVDWSDNPSLAVHDNAASALPAGYTVQLVLDTGTLVSQGLLRSDCADLRVSYVGGGSDVELDRLVESPNTAATKVIFRTQAAIAPGSSDTDYRLHYGNPLAGSPPADPGMVYAFYDDFQDGDAAGWTTKGTWSVVADGANYVYRYTGGGAAWALAYVPVAGLADLDCVVKMRAAASTNWIGSAFRIQDASNFLTFYESKDVGQLKLARIVSDNHSILASPGYPMAAGTWYWLRLQAIGNHVRARIWQDGAAEPGTWLIDQTESAYQTLSGVGATLYYHNTAADWDEFKARRLVDIEPTVSVVANEYTLTVDVYGNGSVIKSPDQPAYQYDDVVTLTAIPAGGSHFVGWDSGLTGNPTTVTIQGDMTVTARFALDVAPWWSAAWGYRAPVTVTNVSGSEALRVGYSVRVLVDAATLAATGRVLGDCSDLRVVSFDGLLNTELDRVVENPGTSQTEVWFALPREVAPGGQDDGFFLYYGNAGAGAPPADGSQVFLFYEDWELGVTHWTNAGGLDPGNTGTMGLSTISALEAFSPGHSQQFPTKASGGDAFSGYVPVLANTGYAIGTWAKSGTTAYLPVGVDPYNASYTKGTEIWLWTNEWAIGTDWSQRSGRFVTPTNAAYLKIKSEWWAEGPGTLPVYLDDLHLRYALASEPTLAIGDEESTVPGPVIADIVDTGPVDLGGSITVSATVTAPEGTIDAVTLRLVSPESRDVAMSLVAGDATSGTWQGSVVPIQGGAYTYRILAHSTTGRSTLSPAHTFLVADSSPPQIALVSVTDPILVRSTQTLVVSVTDNGQVGAVTVTVDGTGHPMSQQGDQYSYSWRVNSVGTVAYTVHASDTGGNHDSLAGSFEVRAREVDVCMWLDGKSGAASFSMDDGNTACFAELQSAGIRGTYYYNGSSTQSWFATYSAAGEEVGSHSVGHPCDAPSCTPSCTPEALWQIPFTQEQVVAYRQDQLDPNIAAIEAGTGLPVVSMAWPCGCVDGRRMTAAGPYFLGVRGYYDYIAQLTWVQDVNEATPVEFMNLNSSNSFSQAHVDQAIAEGKWAIVTSHGSCDGISYMASRQDVLWVAPVGEVLKYIKVRDAAQFSNYAREARSIVFDVAHNLGTMSRQAVDGALFLPIVFDNPVTLQVHILDTDVVLGVTLDDVPVAYTVRSLDGTRYVTFDAALNTPRHVVVTMSAPTPVVDQVTDDGPTEIGSPVTIMAHATVAEGLVHDVTLHVTAPQVADYAMSPVGGTPDTYAASFVPDRVASYACYVSAANDDGIASQSAQHVFTVQDTGAPQWRSLAQSRDAILSGEINVLSGEGLDPGGLRWAVLATDESGAWQEFDWGSSDWWNHQWSKRRAVVIQETAGLARTHELIDVAVSSTEFIGLADCAAELRVADSDRQEVPCQVYDEQSDGGGVTCHLLFQADVGANAERTYYIYYGNPAGSPPSYATDLSSSSAGGILSVRNTYLDLDLDIGSGIVSRVQLPLGTSANLPLSTQANSYWGWHQVCSTADGNITGKNSLCSGGTTPASGLVLDALIDGPLMKLFEFTSQKGAATYRMAYRFVANAPYYQYDLSREGTTASVMNNFWYLNGDFARLGAGTGGSPSSVYNTYDNGADHVRMASFAAVDVGAIDGLDNDGTHLGGADYRYPSAAGLSLHVATGATQTAAEDVLARQAAPLATTLGAEESAPPTQHGSPLDAGGATDWTPTAFPWQNPAIPNGTTVHWRIRYCDLTGNCATTEERSFFVGTETDLVTADPGGACISAAQTCLTVPVNFVRADDTPVRAYSVVVHLSPELAVCDSGLVKGPYLSGAGSSLFQVVDRGGGVYQVDEAILGGTCTATGDGTLFTIRVSSSAETGVGTIVLDSVRVRDCVNAPVPGDAGPAATVTIDKEGPAALAGLAVQRAALGGDSDGKVNLAVTFTPPTDGSRVEMYRKAFGDYPLYGTGGVPSAPTSYPPGGWELTAVTASGGADDPPGRDYWYYVAYTVDECGNATASAVTSGTLNYLLGDVSDGLTECAGNNVVDMADVSLLGAHYGEVTADPEFLTCLDVGPTTDRGVLSRPVPDGELEFEDLVLFALNYEAAGAPGVLPASLAGRVRPAAAGMDAVALAVPALPAVGESFTVRVQASGRGDLQALSLGVGYEPAVVEMEGVEAGELLLRQGSPGVVLTPKAGQVDVALLGKGAGLAGEGTLATVRFRVLAAGDPQLRLATVDGRDAQNKPVAMGVTEAPTLPTVTELGAARPNPFSQATMLGFSLAQGGPAELVIYSVSGRRVRVLARGAREAGHYSVEWDGRDDGGKAVAAGVYFARLTTAQGRFTRPVTYLR